MKTSTAHRAPSTSVTSPAIKISVRYPDWITCHAWTAGRGSCGALNIFDEMFPIRCWLCGRSM